MPDPKNEKVMTKEEIKNLGMQELAEKLYVEFGKLQAHFTGQVQPHDSEESKKRNRDLAENADQVMFGFNDYQYENLNGGSDDLAKDPAANFKKAVKAAVDYLDDTVPSGYSLRDYAEREKITSPEFRYLMNRCMDITGVAPKGLNDDEIAGYDMDEMAERVRFVHDAIFMTLRRNGLKLPEEAMNVVGSLNGYSLLAQPEEKEKSFKDAMGSWDAFFNAKLSNGQTVAEYAEENDLLSYGYEKLVRRAKEIAGIEVAEPVKQAEPQPEQKQAEVAQEPMTMKDYLLGRAKESIKAALDLIPDSPDWGDKKEEVLRHLSKAKTDAQFAQIPENAKRPITDPLLNTRLKEIEMVANRTMIVRSFRDEFDNKTPQEIKSFLTNSEKEEAPVSPEELLERYNERVVPIVYGGEVQSLNNEQEKKEEQKPEQAPEEQKPEQAPEELTDEKIAGLKMNEVADQLYGELAKLEAPLYDDYGKKWSAEAEKVYRYFIDYKGSDGFKKSVEDTQKFLETKLSEDDDKTIADYAKDKKLLGKTFEKLMDRANEITSPTKTAASWIEEQKADLANRIRSNQKGDNYPAADIARIFAARELSNSVRGKKSTLGESISDYKINKRAAEIMENKSFKDFAAKLSKGENLRKVEAIFTKKHSHGGELDDLFRDYLTKRPAGELENDPKLKRWMPTVKQRVEFLQKEAAKTQKENKTPYKEAAEILLLRQAAGVQRGGKGLETKVPVAGEKASSLSEAVNSNADNKDFQKAFDQPDVKKYILAGHGGEMVERLNQQREAEKGKQENGQEKGM